MMKVLLYILIFHMPLLAGCISIPEKHGTLGHYQVAAPATGDSFCSGLPGSGEEKMSPDGPGMLNPQQFILMNWNSYKGKGKQWQDDLDRLISGGDIVTLQEGYLTAQLQEELQQQNFYWDIAAAFLLKNIPSGVLTASRVKPDYLCSFRVKERLTGIPKTVLVTRYPLAERDDKLLLVNVHMVNLSFDISAYSRQLEKMVAVLSEHQGPMIISGDFNSWSKKRAALLASFADELNLNMVQFQDDNRSLFFGRPVDYVFYRGLVPQATVADEVTTSDHNPMLVTFSLANEK
ncbi:MAG: endonuclease/exonuclease/phosphatase family protein [Desulfobulbaceae bacterium]|nr:endonuclease/exonuclease/phosphatase family protein [Desulfobulbaceae bacterium]